MSDQHFECFSILISRNWYSRQPRSFAFGITLSTQNRVAHKVWKTPPIRGGWIVFIFRRAVFWLLAFRLVQYFDFTELACTSSSLFYFRHYVESESLFTLSFLLFCWICFERSSWSCCHCPQELRHVISEYCILCDSGATYHRLSDLMFCDYLRDKHLEVSWGDFSTSRPLRIGHLIFLSYLTSARSNAKSII